MGRRFKSHLSPCQGISTQKVSMRFRPTIPPTEGHDALVLYGGSGNAGIAAACLNYHVITICETNEKRCQAIQERWDKDVTMWRERATAQLSLLRQDVESKQMALCLN